MSTEKQLEYLELISISKALLEGQAILNEMEGMEPDVAFIDKQHRSIAEYTRRITEIEFKKPNQRKEEF
ncbi:hypothetical protein V3595_17295 [Bacillus sp. CFBP9009]